MAFEENVYITLEGGIVLPLSKVTSNYSPSNVVIYDGSVYRDDISGGGGALSHASGVYSDGADNIDNAGDVSSTALPSVLYRKASAPFEYYSISDVAAHIAPRYLGKQRTLWSFARTVLGSAGFTHVVWGDLVLGTSSHAPYRLGMEPTSISA